MCGRFSLTVAEMRDLAERFGALPLTIQLEPHYNFAPSQETIAVVNWQNRPQLINMQWGMVPYWSKHQQKPFPLINVRSESLLEKPSFKSYLAGQRCLIPADGFFEWRAEGSHKIPYRAVLKDESVFAFAGLWSEQSLPDGTPHFSFAIATTEANALTYTIHDRMPVILSKVGEKAWLNPHLRSAQELSPFLKPYPAEEMKIYPVSSEVNSARNNTPACILPKK